MTKIHIGYPKTATTFLQKQIFSQLKNHYFVDHSEFHNSGLIDLIWKADRSIDYSSLINRYSNSNNFISFENLIGPQFQASLLMDEIPYRISKVFGDDCKILITIRRQDELIRSTYVQYVHQGGTLKLKSFIKNNIVGTNRIDLNSFDFFETFSRYSEVFGSANITILPFEYLKDNQEEYIRILNDFFSTENLKFNSSKKNVSLSGFKFRMLRFVNHFVQSRVSEKYIIPPSIINQDALRFKMQKSTFLNKGKNFTINEEIFLKDQLRIFYNSNSKLDELCKLNLKSYYYYK